MVLRGRAFSRSLLYAVALVVAGSLLVAGPAAASERTHWVALSVSAFHSCGIKDDASVACWGRNTYGETRVPPSLSGAKAVAAGTNNTCVIDADDHAVCWGADYNGESDPPADLGAVRAIATGNGATCAIRIADDAAVCWGNPSIVSAVASWGPVHDLSGGVYNICAILRDDGHVACVGPSFFGVPDVPADLGPVWSLSVSDTVACAVTPASAVRCWGDDFRGDLDVPDLGPVTSATAGYGDTCAIRQAGSLACWGQGTGGDLPPTMPSDLGTVGAAGVGASYACALRDDQEIRCWGSDDLGQTDVPGDDFTPPVIRPKTTRAEGLFGLPDQPDWYRADVTVSWDVSDTQSDIDSKTGCDPTTVTSDSGPDGTTLTCEATSGGGTASASIVIHRDSVAPQLTFTASSEPNADGWYRDDVTFDVSCRDDLSGVYDQDGPVTFSNEGEDVEWAACHDRAGNVANERTPDVKIDKTPPTVSITGCPTTSVLAGASVNVGVTAQDALSGLAEEPPATVALDTATLGSRTLTKTVTDRAGNSASDSCTYTVAGAPKLDAPKASANPNKGAFTLSWTAPSAATVDSYDVQRRSVTSTTWSTIASDVADTSLRFTSATPEDEGSWYYRVVAHLGAAVTAPSPSSVKVVVDRTKPAPPQLAVDPARTPDYVTSAGLAWYADSVDVLVSTPAIPADPALADGSPGTGLAKYATSFAWTADGLTTASRTVSDRAGNQSDPGKLKVAVDAQPPAVTLRCPAAPVIAGAVAYATWTASDAGSHLVGAASGKVRLDTSATGAQTASVTLGDHVGHTTTADCSYMVT
jgi:hypothetical protein